MTTISNRSTEPHQEPQTKNTFKRLVIKTCNNIRTQIRDHIWIPRSKLAIEQEKQLQIHAREKRSPPPLRHHLSNNTASTQIRYKDILPPQLTRIIHVNDWILYGIKFLGLQYYPPLISTTDK